MHDYKNNECTVTTPFLYIPHIIISSKITLTSLFPNFIYNQIHIIPCINNSMYIQILLLC